MALVRVCWKGLSWSLICRMQLREGISTTQKSIKIGHGRYGIRGRRADVRSAVMTGWWSITRKEMVCRVKQHGLVSPAVGPSLDGCNNIRNPRRKTKEQDATIRSGLVASCSQRPVSNFGASDALPREAKS